MASDPSTKLQINFKWEKDGDMINIYAANQAELEQHLTTIQDLATLIMSTSQSLRGVASLKTATSIAPTAPALQHLHQHPILLLQMHQIAVTEKQLIVKV
jgi:hypothetical protein